MFGNLGNFYVFPQLQHQKPYNILNIGLSDIYV